MSCSTSFQAHLARFQLGEKANYVTPAKLLAQRRFFHGVHPVQLENMLRRVHTNSDNLRHGRLPCLRSQRPHSGTLMPLGAVHPNTSLHIRERQTWMPGTRPGMTKSRISPSRRQAEIVDEVEPGGE